MIILELILKQYYQRAKHEGEKGNDVNWVPKIY